MTTIRREVSSRSNSLIQKTAQFLNNCHISPNTISVFSIIFSLLTPIGCFFIFQQTNNVILGFFLAVLGIQLRLLCNVIDGLVAIEGQQKTILGGIYNELPDRITDTIILLSVSYLFAPLLGFILSLLAMLTAYIRLLGGTLGATQTFAGPAAKQHRMAVVTILLLLIPLVKFETFQLIGFYSFLILCALTLYTSVNRLKIISKELTLQKDQNV
jgi:phosphatidylglycerophosphate synthase